ncbi:hypothetical protein [uncultured Gammaproteobacteria bacterium]|nr:hypothetical protein [uncultured Gammaproteobacteria bacterium]
MCFHPMGEAVFWLKSLYQLGFVRFFGFYFWIRVYTFLKLGFVYHTSVF